MLLIRAVDLTADRFRPQVLRYNLARNIVKIELIEASYCDTRSVSISFYI
jgi:hypothetical protein